MATIRVDEEVRAAVIAHALELSVLAGRYVSASEAIADLLGLHEAAVDQEVGQ